MASSSQPPSRVSLRDYLLSALSGHPGSRKYHLHVLTGAARKSNNLYPFATPKPPRVYVQDVVIFLSEDREDLTGKVGGKEKEKDERSADGEPKVPRILIYALEATLYIIPPTSTFLIYISKLDTSGHTTISNPPPTSLLTRTFLSYYLNPTTRPLPLAPPTIRHVWVQLFARAPPLMEKQYLFAGSGEWEGKQNRWRGDRGLCVWWKRVLERIVEEVVRDLDKEADDDGVETGMYYLLPGFSKHEAEETLRIASASFSVPSPTPGPSQTNGRKIQWTYGHPYSLPSESSTPFPCPYDPSDPEATSNLGRCIPYFDDCPKSRFLDEIAYATEGEVRSPQKKKRKRTEGEEDSREVVKEKEVEKEKRLRPLGEMSRVTPEEFWERMSFRQECVSGAVTGFFTIFVSLPPQTEFTPTSTPSPLQPQPGQVSSQIVKRVLTTLLTGMDFSDEEKAVRSTEIVEGTIKSLCEGRIVPTVTKGTSAGANALARTILGQGPVDRPKTPEPEDRPRLLTIPQTPPPNRHNNTWGEPPSKQKHGHVPEVSPNPFTEPVVTAETYGSYIYGIVTTRNPVLGDTSRSAQQAPKHGNDSVGNQVTVLAVRKKAKTRKTMPGVL